MGGIAVIAMICAWPLLISLVGVILIYVTRRKVGLSFADRLTVAATPLVLAGLLVPAVHTNCRRRPAPSAPAPSPPSASFTSAALGVFLLDGPASVARLTDDGREKARPMWSPDGKKLAFARHESGGSHIWQYVMDAGDPRSATRLTDRKPPEFHAAFSPDGKTLALAIVELSGTQGNLDIALVGADGANLKAVVSDINNHLSHQDWPSLVARRLAVRLQLDARGEPGDLHLQEATAPTSSA